MTTEATTTLNHTHFDQVGSLLRTAPLKAARQAYFAGEITKAQLIEVQHEEIAKLVIQETTVGLKAVTDGEFARSWWHLDFIWGLNGIEAYEQTASYKFHGAKTRTTNVRLVDKIAFNPEHPFFADFSYLQSVLPEGVEAKVTIPSPSLIPNRDGRSDGWEQFYPTWEAFLDDLAKAYHETLLHFYDLGARYIQLDDTTWAFLIARLNEHDADYAKYVKQCADIVYVVNQLLADLPADLRVSTHICRGNFKSTYLFEGGYAPIAKYLGQLNYDTFFLEFDDARSGDFEPLTEIYNNRKNILLVLGLVISKQAQLEAREDIIQRIELASQYVPLEQLALSTQCGFASTEEGNTLTDAEQWAKLKFVKSVAQEVWG